MIGDRVLIRQAQSNDLGQVLPLLRQLWPNKHVDPERVSPVFERGLASPDTVYLCADDGGRVVGFCSVLFRSSIWQECEMAYIEILVVDESARCRGTGTRMIEAAIDAARVRGCSMVQLDSALHRERAHGFYERLGFEKLGYAFLRSLP